MTYSQSPDDPGTWLLSIPCTRQEGEMLAEDLPAFLSIDTPPVLVSREVDEKRPEDWVLDCYFEDEPDAATIRQLAALLPSFSGSLPAATYVAPDDWVTMSQTGLEPLRVGRFYIHTSYESPDPAARNYCIDPAQAFGTGHHETTHGCLAMIDKLEVAGRRFFNIADIGTGTGLLAFAARDLWPLAAVLASDIDPVAVATAERYAAQNHVPIGVGRGAVDLFTASGSDHPVIWGRAPYDLLIANILAGPLVELAPGFGAIVADGGTLILAGLLQSQQGRVAAAYRAQGFRLVEAAPRGEWPTLRFVKRRNYAYRRPTRASGRTSQGEGDYGEW
jgi:ribosomal protein L11 methyltransferase